MIIDDILNTCYVLGTVLTAKELKAFFFKRCHPDPEVIFAVFLLIYKNTLILGQGVGVGN